ncbi:Bud site selection protein bud4 [Tulasnella sp. 330]|nr:Bud site selection protein bud4 [Tulasnella sp. 330]
MSSPILPVTHHRSFSPRPIERPPSRTDPLKESILANSRHAGWAAATIASPLKLSKPLYRLSQDDESPTSLQPQQQLPVSTAAPGDSKPNLARRGSSSFSHVRNGSLVSKSPFKSPTPGSESEDSAQVVAPIGAKFKPSPQWQTGGYKLASPNSRSAKTSGTTPRKASPGSKRASPSQSQGAARRASLEKKKKLIENENFRKALAMEAAASGAAKAGLGITGPTQLPGLTKRKSNGLVRLESVERVTKSPFVAIGKPNSNASSPSLSSSTTPSPQTTHDEELDEPATPIASEEYPDVEVQRETPIEHSTPSRMASTLQHSANAPGGSPGLSPYKNRPLPSSPSSRQPSGQRNTSPSHSTPSVVYTMSNMATPTKSSLKTKRRIRGPRSPSDHSPEYKVQRTASGRMRRYGSLKRAAERRKTVTFDERCAVLEFERDEDLDEGGEEWVTTEDEEMFGSDGEPYQEGYEDEEGEEASGVAAIHGLVNEILEDEMAGFRDERDGSTDYSIDSRREIAEVDENRSIDFNEANTSLDFCEGNTSLDFDPQATVNRSLDFHEGDSFDASMQQSFPHLMANHQRESYSIQEDDEDEGGQTENEGEVRALPSPRQQRRGQDHGSASPNQSANLSSSSLPYMASSRESLGQIHDATRVEIVRTGATTILTPTGQRTNSRDPFHLEGEGGAFGSLSTLSASSSTSSLVIDPARSASPRISRDDVKKRMMIKQLGVSSMLQEIDAEEDVGTEEDEDLSRRPSPRRASSSSPSPLRVNVPFKHALPALPSPVTAGQLDTVGLMTVARSHDAILQSTEHEDDIDPQRPTLGGRAHTTDGNLPASAPPPANGFSTNPPPFDFNRPGASIGDVKSALDRLMIGVENGFMDDRTSPPPGMPHSRPTSFNAQSGGEATQVAEKVLEMTNNANRVVAQLQHAQTSFHSSEALHGMATTTSPAPRSPQSDAPSGSGWPSTISPNTTGLQVPSRGATLTRVKSGKQVIKEHEAAILAKRRELRSRDSVSTNGSGRPKKRRSLSTGDADSILQERRSTIIDSGADLLEVGYEEVADIPLSDSIERELKKLHNEKVPTYRLREHERTIYASSDDRVTHMGRVGDVDSGKAWRAVRRPSDMNEYSRQIREYRAQEKPGKAHGKVFVKVLGIRGINVPLPPQPTVFNLTLNNGIHCVATPDSRLGKECRIDQEFELIEHGQLEFTLKVTVRKDPHILAQMQYSAPLPPPPPPSPPRAHVHKSSGIFGLFGNQSKKGKTHKRAATQPETISHHHHSPRAIPENLAKYLKSDGTLGQAFIPFKDVAKRCDTRLFETSYPIMGQAADDRGSRSGRRSSVRAGSETRQVGEIILQLFRLPPLPGVRSEQLPQSLEECHRGLRHIAWHKVMYHEGVLTQNGGDCSTWRRRHVKIIGANLVAFNDVTNKATTTIDLKKAVAVVDDQDPTGDLSSPGRMDDDDYVYVERSFRLMFPNSTQIAFFTDTDEEKAQWLDILRALIGHIPPNPLWAELVWQRQEEMAAATATSPSSSARPSNATLAVPR